MTSLSPLASSPPPCLPNTPRDDHFISPDEENCKILIATSIAGSAFAAPAPAEMHDARTDLSELDRRWELGSTTTGILKTAPLAGPVAAIGVLVEIERWGFLSKRAAGRCLAKTQVCSVFRALA